MDIVTYALAKKFAKDYTDSEIEKLEGISYEVVDHLPDVGDESKIYLVSAGAGNDSYEEYIYINGTFERLGYLDLSEYVKKVMIADMYSNEATYAVGDVVINEDILYKCKVAINVPEEFNGEHWDEILLQDEIDNLENTKQDALATQTAYTAQGSATKVPQITTNTLGQVTNITEVTITDNNDNQKVKTSSVTFGDNDVVEIVGGNNVTVTGNANDATITIAATDTTYGVATSSTAGLVKSSTTGTTAFRDYNVEVNNDGTMKVNVPWVNTSITSADLEEFNVGNDGYLSEKYTVIGSSRTWSDVTSLLSPSAPLYNIIKYAIPLLSPDNITKIEELDDARVSDLGAISKCLVDETLNNGTTAQCLGTQRPDLNSSSMIWSNNNIYYVAFVTTNNTFGLYRLTYDYSNSNTGIYRLMFEIHFNSTVDTYFNLYFDYAALLDGLQTLAQLIGLPIPTEIDLDELKTEFDSMTDTEKCGVIEVLAGFALSRSCDQGSGPNYQVPFYSCQLDTSTGDFSVAYKQGDSATTIFNVSDITSTSYDISLIANVGGFGSSSGSVTPTDIELNLQRWMFKINSSMGELAIFSCFSEEELSQIVADTNSAIDDANTTYSISLSHITDFSDLNTVVAEALAADQTGALANSLYAKFIYELTHNNKQIISMIATDATSNSKETVSAIFEMIGNILISFAVYDDMGAGGTYQHVDLPSITGTSTYVTFSKLKGEGVASSSSSGSDKKYNVIKMNVPQSTNNSRHVYFLPSNSNMNYIYQVLSDAVGFTVNADNFNSVMVSIFTGASSINDLYNLLAHLPNACEKIYLETTLTSINKIYMRQTCSGFKRGDNTLQFVTLPIGELDRNGIIITPTAGTTEGELADWQTVTVTLENYKANDGDDIYDQETA